MKTLKGNKKPGINEVQGTGMLWCSIVDAGEGILREYSGSQQISHPPLSFSFLISFLSCII